MEIFGQRQNVYVRRKSGDRKKEPRNSKMRNKMCKTAKIAKPRAKKKPTVTRNNKKPQDALTTKLAKLKNQFDSLSNEKLPVIGSLERQRKIANKTMKLCVELLAKKLRAELNHYKKSFIENNSSHLGYINGNQLESLESFPIASLLNDAEELVADSPQPEIVTESKIEDIVLEFLQSHGENYSMNLQDIEEEIDTGELPEDNTVVRLA